MRLFFFWLCMGLVIHSPSAMAQKKKGTWTFGTTGSSSSNTKNTRKKKRAAKKKKVSRKAPKRTKAKAKPKKATQKKRQPRRSQTRKVKPPPRPKRRAKTRPTRRSAPRKTPILRPIQRHKKVESKPVRRPIRPVFSQPRRKKSPQRVGPRARPSSAKTDRSTTRRSTDRKPAQRQARAKRKTHVSQGSSTTTVTVLPALQSSGESTPKLVPVLPQKGTPGTEDKPVKTSSPERTPISTPRGDPKRSVIDLVRSVQLPDQDDDSQDETRSQQTPDTESEESSRRHRPPPPRRTGPRRSHERTTEESVRGWERTRNRVREHLRHRQPRHRTRVIPPIQRLNHEGTPTPKTGSMTPREDVSPSHSGHLPYPLEEAYDTRPGDVDQMSTQEADLDGSTSSQDPAPMNRIHESEDWEPDTSTGWYRGLTLRGGVDMWSLSLMDDKSASSPGVDTRETYRIDPLYLYRLHGTLSTRYLDIHGAYASDQGLDIVQDPSIALDFLVAFTGIDVLRPLSLNVRHLDFDYGRVTLEDRLTGTDIEEARFKTTLSRYELRYALGPYIYLLGQMQTYGLPRNVYLEVGGTMAERFQISDQLLHVDARFYGLGIGLETPQSTAPGWHGGLRMSAGTGRYDIRTIVGRQKLDSGDLSAIDITVRAGHRWALTPTLQFGMGGELNLLDVNPVGLPDDLDEDLRAEGIDTSGTAIRFGKKDMVSALSLELVWSI